MVPISNPPDRDPIFAPDQNWHCNACLNWADDPLELYIEGYKQAADTLVNQVDESGENQDTLVYPICFLYRQYIELRLKEIIRSGRRLLDDPGQFPQHHKIQNLWDYAVPLLKKVFANESTPLDLSIPSYIVSEFAKVDPESIAFRYPFDNKGANPLKGIWHINLRLLADSVNAFASDIDAASMAISVYLDSKWEMQSDY